MNKSTAMPEEQEKVNRSKYGPKEDDVIARTYRDNHRDGDMWCSKNVEKYLFRYTREGSSKKGIYENLLKAKDYLDRMIEANKPIVEIHKKSSKIIVRKKKSVKLRMKK